MKHRMDRSTKVRIAILVILMLTTWAIEADANTITLPMIVHKASNTTVSSHTFITTIHGRPVELYVTINQDIWTLEVTELDEEPTPTITPSITIEPTITPEPTPYTGLYASLDTSDIFHKVTCSYLVGKDPSRLTYYTTCEEAFAAGKRPCSRCKPCPIE